MAGKRATRKPKQNKTIRKAATHSVPAGEKPVNGEISPQKTPPPRTLRGRGRLPAGHTKCTPALKDRFIQVLRENGGIVADACRDLNVGRRTVYDERDADPDFKAQWEKAVDDGIDVLEDEAKTRAKEGVHEPIYYQGEIVGYVRRPSDMLMGLILAGYRKRYIKRQELSGPEGKPLETGIHIYLPDNGRAVTLNGSPVCIQGETPTPIQTGVETEPQKEVEFREQVSSNAGKE